MDDHQAGGRRCFTQEFLIGRGYVLSTRMMEGVADPATIHSRTAPVFHATQPCREWEYHLFPAEPALLTGCWFRALLRVLG
jgi:hypothetical protein